MSEAYSSTYFIYPGGIGVPGFEAILLVACNEERDCSSCDEMFGMPTGEGGTSEISRTSSTKADFEMKVGAYHYGLYHCITS